MQIIQSISIKFALKSTYNLLGSISLGNGIWMLFGAKSWFHNMPVGATDTGHLNEHFVHDVGWVYCLIGMGALYLSRHLKKATLLHWPILLFMAGHALIHAIEILMGKLPISHWWIDFPLVTFPAIVLVIITPFVLKIRHQS